MHGLNTREYQPTKLAAIEAIWDTGAGLPLTLFAIPDEAAERNDAAVEIPYLGSLILTHEWTGTVRGLKEWPREDRPPVAIPFFAFRIMVGLGLLMLLVVVIAWALALRRRLFDTAWFLRLCQFAAPLGFFAVLAGWVTTEVGRQPWTVYGLMRTADSVSPSLTGRDVLLSLLGYVLVYLVMYPAGLVAMARIARRGPVEVPAESPVEAGRPLRPVSALPRTPQSGEAAP
jgi:cytochrome d ubiquinol oxidase subunit I